MKSSRTVVPRLLVAGLTLFGLTACAGVGLASVADVLGAGNVSGFGQEVRGSIRQVDTRRQQIHVEVARGRTERLNYDGRTEVVYQRRRYAVRDLERGDLVRIRVDERRRGEYYARSIQVQQSVSDSRTGSPGNVRVQRFEGMVGRIDTRQGWFELHQNRGGVVVVTLPYEPSRGVRDRFRRLRRGETVRLEGHPLNRTRVEVHRFM
jgi:hypothetical protein